MSRKISFVPDGLPCLTQRVLAAVGPWHMLVGCAMLNRTHRRQAWPALERFFEIVREPEELAGVPDEALEPVLRPCGLARRRLDGIRKMTEDYLAGLPVSELRHVGKYGRDSFEIFMLGIRPEPGTVGDHELEKFLVETEDVLPGDDVTGP